jgi:exodeoxyribonuclease V alpha subunit
VEIAEKACPLPCAFDVSGLNEEQAAALQLIEANGVAILTGPPGCGKTFTITKAIVSLLGSGIRSIHIATPTGKAARRAAELLQGKLPNGITIPCTTIHRLLGPKPNLTDAPGVPSDVAKMGRGRDSFSFTHNEADPILVDFLVIDESSMIDVRLGASLLRAVAPGTRVVFVGDHNQLPSVGPGSLLRDMMESGVPTAQLTQIQRNSGRIVRACHAIKDGVVPEPAPAIDLAIGDNWFHIELEDPHQIAKQIVELHRTYRNFPDPVWDLQIVTPQKSRLPIACDNLNRLLSAKLNHFGKAHEEGEASEPDEDNFGDGSGDDEGARMAQDIWVPFRRGDKVIRTKNGLCDLMTRIEPVTDRADPEAGESTRTDWRWDLEAWSLSETDIVNGDMGTVMDIVEDGKDTYVVVKFRMPERLCRLPFGECHLSQAYAITCHKAQGSGYSYVIVPVHHSFYWDSKTQRGLFNREWIYTAISRSERMLMTVGQFSAVRAAVGRRTVHRRKTRLVSLLKDSFGVPA